MNFKQIKLSTLIIAAVILYAAGMSTWTFFRTPKIAFVETNILMDKSKLSVAARSKINAQNEQWTANLKTLETELARLNDAMVKEGSRWDKKTVVAKKEELEKKQLEYARYNRAVQEKSAKLEQDMIQPVFNELNAAINDYAKSKGYDLVLGTLNGGNILYGSKGVNITDEFIEYVNAR